MKCFKIFTLLFISFSVSAQDNIVFPKNNNTFSNGDRATLIVESPLSDEELRQFENTKITDVIYVFALNIEGASREFEVIFSDPPEKQTDKERPFIAKGINYTFDKERAGDKFIFMESNFNPKLKNKYFAYSVYIFLAFLLGLLIYHIFKNYSELKQRNKLVQRHAGELIDLFTKSRTRTNYETIFKRRREFIELIELPENKWQKLISKIDELQFRKNWSEEDLAEVKSLALKIKDLRARRGI